MDNFVRPLLLILLNLVIAGQPLNLSFARQASGDPRAFQTMRKAYGELPISFEVNQGQTDRAVQFLARGQGYTLFLKAGEAVLTLREAGERAPSAVAEANGKRHPRAQVLRMKFVGADPAALPAGIDKLPGVTNYFIGNDPKQWHKNVPTYREVKCQNIYPGIDLVYYGTQAQLEYDLVIAPGANPEKARMRFEGGTARINPQGDLVVQIGSSVAVFHKPQAYQMESAEPSTRHAIRAEYVLNSQNQVGFHLAGYDAKKTVFIDPVLSYSTYLGGLQGDTAYGIALDASGDAYIVGSTASSNFPTVSAHQGANGGDVDVFVTKLNSTGSSLLFSTYLGGNGYDAGSAIAVDGLGYAYLTGTTSSANFPVSPTGSTPTAFQTSLGGNDDAFVAKLDPTGATLVYSSYLGGSGADFGQGIAVDPTGSAYVTGSTQSLDFPTIYPFQGGNDGGSDAFVAKINATGTALNYSTYLGGGAADSGQAIAVDAAGRAYVTGYTNSTNFPTLNALQGSNAGSADVFVTQLNPDGLTLVYSTYLGGSGLDRGKAIALDTSGNVYITGDTQSSAFPVTGGVFQSRYAGNGDAFVAKVGVGGTSLSYSTLLGGTNSDQGTGIAVDNAGNAYVTGFTQSSDFPTSNPVQAHFGGGTCSAGALPCPDAFVTEVNPQGTALGYSTFLGGSGADYGQAIAVDTSGLAYVTGGTTSADFTPVAGAYQGTPGDTAGNGDAFVAKIDPANAAGVALTPQTINFGNQALFTSSPVQTVTLTNVGTLPLHITAVTTTGDFTETDNCLGTMAPSGGFCTISLTFTPTALEARTDEVSITDDATGSPHQITVTGTGVNPTTTVQLSPAALAFASQSINSTSPTRTVTLTNTGDIALTITDITATGDFAQTNNCPVTPATLGVGASCTLFITFSPTTTGSRGGTISITDNAAGSPQTVALSGTGIAGFSLSVSNPSKIIMIGSTTTTFTISASGPPSFTDSIALSCESGATCAFSPASLTVGQSSTVTVSGLSSSTTNPFNFTVDGTSSTTTTETATLALTIFFADYTVTATPNLNSLAAGQSTTYVVTVTPSNGFNGSVLLSCTAGLPAGGSCVFAPSAVAPNGSSSITSTLTVTTTARSAKPLIRPPGVPPPGMGTVMLLSFLVLLALLLAACRTAASRSPASVGGHSARLLRGRSLVVAAMLLLLLMGLSMSCENTISNLIQPANSTGSQVGNYTITIDGSLGGGSSTVDRTTSVNLAVS